MRSRRENRKKRQGAIKPGATAVMAIVLVTIAWSISAVQGFQAPRAGNFNQAQPPNNKAGQGRAPGGAIPKPLQQAPQVQDPMTKALTQWPAKIKFKIAAYDNSPLAASYYPARKNPNAPVVVLIHDLNQTSRDFESGIEEWKGRTIAEILQKEGYAVVLFDLRGQGNSKGAALRTTDLLQTGPDLKSIPQAKGSGNPRPSSRFSRPNSKRANGKDKDKKEEDEPRTLSPQLLAKVIDLQAVYAFLLDRHNRGEFNIAKLGILATGDGSNLVAGWAAMPTAAVASPRPVGDIAAMVLISPEPSLELVEIKASFRALSKRLPMILIAGQDDVVSDKVLRENLNVVEEGNPKSRIESFARSSLRGAKLIRFEPGVTKMILDFFERTLKLKTDEWEPRYNLEPVAVTRGEFSPIAKFEDAANPIPPANPNIPPN